MVQLCSSCGFESPEKFKFCGRCGSPLESERRASEEPTGYRRRHDDEVKDQRRVATILFADIDGFDAVGQKLDPEQVHTWANEYFEIVRGVVESCGGVIDKYIGDAVMAVFGAPLAHGDDPARSVQAALDIREGLREYLQRLTSAAGVDVGLKIGVNTGRVVWGGVGKGGAVAGNVTVVGDAVNLASRLESNAPIGSIQIGETTYRHVRGKFKIEERDPIEVKGKSRPVPVYLVHGVIDHGAMSTVMGGQRPLVGRIEELELLHEELEAVEEERRAKLINLFGPAGMGKSRLLLQFRRDVHEEGVGVLVARPAPFGPGSVWAPWVALLRRLQREVDPRESAPPHVRAAIDYLLGEGDPSDEQLAALRSHPAHLGPRLSAAMRELLTQLAAERTWLLVAEDVYAWPDESRALLAAVVSVTSPILFVTTLRNEDDRGWPPRGIEGSMVELGPLNDSEMELMLRGILGDEAVLPDAVMKRVAELAEGNPFFLEEIARGLIDGEILTATSDSWEWNEDAWAEHGLPETVESSLQARLDRLEPDQQRILQKASVAGIVFWDDLLVNGLGEPEARRHLARLCARELVAPRRRSRIEGPTEYVFKNASIRAVAYQNILIKERGDYHRQTAEWLEKVAGNEAELAEALADHYLKSGDGSVTAKALPHLVTAASRALEAGAVRRALEQLDRAVGLLQEADTDQLRLQVYAERGRARRLSGDADGAVEDLEVALAIAQQCDELAAAAQICVDLAGVAHQRADWAKLERYGHSALDAAQKAQEAQWEAIAYNLLGIAASKQGDLDAALKHYEKAMEVDEAAGNLAGVGVRLSNMAAVHMDRDDFRSAADTSQRALAMPLRKGSEAIARSNLGLAYGMLGRMAQAADELSRAEKVAVEAGFHQAHIVARIRSSWLQLARGDASALARLDQARQAAEKMGALEQVAEAWWLRGIALALSHPNEAHNSYERCIAVAEPNKLETLLRRAKEGLSRLP